MRSRLIRSTNITEVNINENSINDCSYILITPCKNEEGNLPGLIESITSQIIKPYLWIVVDDCSDDNTANILRGASKNYSWIYYIRLNKRSKYSLDEHYSKICRFGFNYARSKAKIHNYSYKYIALSDADMIYTDNYFKDLMYFMETNQQYGIVSGNVQIMDSKNESYEIPQAIEEFKYPLGTGRVWRKRTFEDTGGYIITKAPDAVSNIKALLNGWKITQLSDVKCYQTRETGGKEGLWKGHFSMGERAYFLNVNILSVVNTIVCYFTFSKQKHAFTKSLAYLLGYIDSFVKRKNKIKDEEVKHYYGSYSNVLKRYKVYSKKILNLR